MAKQSSRPVAPAPSEGQESTGAYAPRTYSSREQILFSAKLALIVGVLVLLLWLLDKNI